MPIVGQSKKQNSDFGYQQVQIHGLFRVPLHLLNVVPDEDGGQHEDQGDDQVKLEEGLA